MRRAVILLAAGCGAAPAAEPPDAAVSGAPDAPPAPPDAAAPAPCMAPEPLGELAPLADGAAVIDLGDAEGTYRIDYNAPVAPTVLVRFALLEGHGVFTGGFATGAHAIADDDAAVATCGLCLLLVTRYYEPAASQYFVADAGTVTFDRLDEAPDGRLAGVATDVALTRVIYKDEQWRPDEGCATSIARLPFDVALEAGPFYEP